MRYKLYAVGELPFLQINAFGYSSEIKETTFGPRKRDLFLVGYVLSGKGFYNSRPLGACEGFIVTPDIIEHIIPDPDDPWELLWFTTIDRRMGDLLKYYNADEKTNIFTHRNPVELQEIKNFLITNSQQTVSHAQMLELFFSLFKHHMQTPDDSSEKQSAAEGYIDFSVNYIKANCDKNITVSTLTKLLGVSQPYLYKLFKTTFGISPKSYITSFRTTRAKELLEETDLSIAEIACSVGFSDTFAFSKCFSSNVGISPSEYRKLHKKA